MPAGSLSARVYKSCVRDHLQPNEINERRNKPNRRDSSHKGDVPKGIFIEFEPRWLREEHGAHKSPFSRIESSSDNSGESYSLIVLTFLWTSSADDLGAAK